MAFESLTERLQNVFKNLRRKGKSQRGDVQGEAAKRLSSARFKKPTLLPVVETLSRSP